MALVNVLVKVLDGCEGITNLHVDMGVIFCTEINVVWHNPFIIQLDSSAISLNKSAIFSSSVHRVPRFGLRGFWSKSMWVLFLAPVILHTNSIVVQITTRTHYGALIIPFGYSSKYNR